MWIGLVTKSDTDYEALLQEKEGPGPGRQSIDILSVFAGDETCGNAATQRPVIDEVNEEQDEISYEGYKDNNKRRGEAKSDVFYLSAMQVGYRGKCN